MKILFLGHDSLKGGSGRCLYELILQLKPSDNIKPVVLLHNKNSLYEALKQRGVETYFCRFGYTCSSSKSWWMFFFWKYIYRHLANIWAYVFLRIMINLKTVDYIHSNSMVIDFGAFLHRRTGIPLIWHMREFGDLDFHLKSFYPSLPQYMCDNSMKIISVSNVVKSHFINNGGSPDKIKCVYDGVIGDKYENCGCSFSDDSTLKFVMCGRLSEEKGQAYAIEALHNLPPNFLSKVQLDFYGAGTNEKYLRELVDLYNLEKYVNFCGFSNTLENKLKKYDVGLVLSASEGFGRITVEYLLSGLYVIGSNTGATPEVLDNGKYGSLVPFGNSLAVAKEMEKIIAERSVYKKIAQDGREFAKKNFCIEQNYKKIFSIYYDNCKND